MKDLHRINRQAAEGLFSRFIPLFAEFEKCGVDYCLVGGLAVVAHCLKHDAERFRATEDADALLPQNYSNADFARDYLRVYAADPKFSKAIYEAVVGESGFAQLNEAENAFVNVSFVGADEDLDGIDTPDFDVCRTLNGKSLESIERERVEVLGQSIWVATVNELIDMKRSTIAIYGFDIQTTPRPQDFIDVDILEGLSDGGSNEQNGPGLFPQLGHILGGR